MEPRKKHKRIIYPVQKQGEESGFKATFQWSTPPEFKVLNPRTPEEWIAALNAEIDGRVLWKTEKLSVEEIIERYSLTEEQITKLKEYGK